MSCRKSVTQWAASQNLECHSFESIDSTNTFAKSLPWEMRQRVIVSDHQSQGRGRGTNTWEDLGNGTQLLSSWVFELRHPPQPIATARIGLALWRACDLTWPEAAWSLKAPNDLLLNGQKVAGLLVEVITHGDIYRLVIGLGLNITGSPKSLPNATSISSIDPKADDRLEVFLDHWWVELNDALPDFVHTELPVNICASLCEALNKNPNLRDLYLQVFPDGSLQTSTGKIDWLSL